METSDLPALNAVLNASAMVFLVAGYVSIRRQKWKTHRLLMLAALLMSALFLISYLIYHAQEGSKPYEGEGIMRVIYFAILIPHVILAAGMLPFILLTLYRAWKNPWDRHARIARITLPVWMYVSVTGVLVYLMLYQL
ncbi:MAG: DUF420 domain-containing protein [Chloroflexi bacterium]|nr:DUF420 domain-containing protein [Chloroflexota bacterium]